jgi:YVTN family beta-propeller protein
VKQIKIHVKDSTETSATLTTGTSKTLVADIIDRNGLPMTNVTLRWNSSQPLVAVAGTATVSGSAAGTATITASCTPSDCNTGLTDVIYSNAFLTTVSGTSTTTVYVGSHQSTTVVPIDTSTNTAGTAVTLGDKPNSMMFNTRGSKLYIGTATGLIVLDTATNTFNAPFAALPGKVIGVSPDENTVLISDNTSVYAFFPNTQTGSFTPLAISGAVSASFAPDSSKAYIVGNGKWTVWNSSITPDPQSVAGANDVSFLATGAFGYIAASGTGVGVRATCNDSSAANVVTSGTPTLIRALPNGTQLVALSAPNIDLITADTENIGCPPSVQNSAVATSLAGSFVPRQLILTPNGSKAYVTSDQGGVLLGYDVATRSRAPIQLTAGVTQTFTGGVTLDSKQLYVGTNDGVHRIDLTTGQDAQTITVNLGTDSPAPDLVAVKPK